MPVAEDGVAGQLRHALRLVLGRQRRAFAAGLAAALLLAVPDLGRQLLVRDDPSYAHALLVDVVGVLTAALVQLALVGLVAGEPARRWLTGGVRLLLVALRERPVVVLAGLVCAGAVSALLTVPASVAALGVQQVIGPLTGPPISALLLAQASDVVATAVTAPYFAVLVATSAGAPARRYGAA